MKTLFIVASILIAVTAIAGDVTRIYVKSQQGYQDLVQGQNAQNLRTPTALAPTEIKFGGSDKNPVRKPIGWRVTESVIVTNVSPTNGVEIIVTNQVPVAWVYCKVENGEVVAMTQAEKDLRDQEIATKKQEQEDAETEAIYDNAVLIQAVLLCLKDSNPSVNLPSKAEVKTKYKQLKGW